MNYEEKRYSYSLWQTLVIVIPPLFAVLVGCALLLYGLISIALPELEKGPFPASEPIGPIAAALVFLVLGSTLLTIHTEIIVSESGMKARALLFTWVTIPWDEVLDVTITPLPGYNDPDRWRFIRVKRLSLFHRLASLSYGTGTHPVLIITGHLDGYEELVETIKGHIMEQGLQGKTCSTKPQ